MIEPDDYNTHLRLHLKHLSPLMKKKIKKLANDHSKVLFKLVTNAEGMRLYPLSHRKSKRA